MKGHQVNIRVSDATLEQLQYLRQFHGSVSEAIAVAVDRLAREHKTEKQPEWWKEDRPGHLP